MYLHAGDDSFELVRVIRPRPPGNVLDEGGCPPGLVLVKDGRRSICHDGDDPTSGEEGMNGTSVDGEQMHCRLIKFQEHSITGSMAAGRAAGSRGERLDEEVRRWRVGEEYCTLTGRPLGSDGS